MKNEFPKSETLLKIHQRIRLDTEGELDVSPGLAKTHQRVRLDVRRIPKESKNQI